MESLRTKGEEYIWVFIRLSLGFVYLWAFLDKTFGLGFTTASDKSWLEGNSPTYGYLMHGTKGPFAEIFQSLSGSEIVTWLFMLGILFIGFTLISGILLRLGALAAMVMYFLFYVSGFMPPEHNPIIDEHVINFVLMIGLYIVVPTKILGFGDWWQNLDIVKRYPVLR